MDYLTKGVTDEKSDKENHCIDVKFTTCTGLLSPVYKSNETGKCVLGKHEESNTLSSEQMKPSPIVSFDSESVSFEKKSKSVPHSFLHPTVDGSTYVTNPFLRSQSPMSPFLKCYKEQNFNDYFFFDPQTSSESFSKNTTITLPCLVNVANNNTLKEPQNNRMLAFFTHDGSPTRTETTCMKEAYGLTNCIESNAKALIPFTVRPRIWNKNNIEVSQDHHSLSHYEKIFPTTTFCSIPSDMASNTPPLTSYSTNTCANWITPSTNENWGGSTCHFQSDLFQSPQKQRQQDTSTTAEHFKKKSVLIETPSFEEKIKTKSNFFLNKENFQTTHDKKNSVIFQPFKIWCETQEESNVEFQCISPIANQHVLNESNKSKTQSPSFSKGFFHSNADETLWKTSTHTEHPSTHFETAPVTNENLKDKSNEIKDFSITHPESNAVFPKFNSPITPSNRTFNEIEKPTHTLHTPSNKSLFEEGFRWNEPCFSPTSPFTQIRNDECHTQNIIHPTFTSKIPMDTTFPVESCVNHMPTVPPQESTYKLQKSPKETLNASNAFQKTFQCKTFSINSSNNYTCLSKSKKKYKKKMKQNTMENVPYFKNQQASHTTCQNANECNNQNDMFTQMSHETLPYPMTQRNAETMSCNISASSSGEYLSTEAFQYKMLYSCKPEDGSLLNSLVENHLSPQVNILEQFSVHDVQSTINTTEKYNAVETQNMKISLPLQSESPKCCHLTSRCMQRKSDGPVLKSTRVDSKTGSLDDTVVEEYTHQRNAASHFKEPLIQGNTSLDAPFSTQQFSSESFLSSNQLSFEKTLASTGDTCHPTQPVTSCADSKEFPQLQSTDTCSQINSNRSFFELYPCEPFDSQMSNAPFYSKSEKWNISRKPYSIVPEQHTLPLTDIPSSVNAPISVPPMDVCGISTTAFIPRVPITLDTTSQFLENMDSTRSSYGSTKFLEESSNLTSSFSKTKRYLQPAYFQTTPSLYNPCVSENLLQKLQNISHLEPAYKKFLKNIPRKSKEAFTPSDFAAFRTCHPEHSKNCFILMQNGYDIRLGEIGRAALKKEISRRLKSDSKLRERCVSVVCRLKNANVLQLLQMAEISGCLALGLKISSMYWKEYSRKQKPSMSIKEYTQLCTSDPGHSYNEQVHWNYPGDVSERQVNYNQISEHYAPLSFKIKGQSCFSMKRYLDYNNSKVSSPLKRHKAFLMDTTNHLSLKNDTFPLENDMCGGFKIQNSHLPERKIISDSSKNDTTSCCFPIIPNISKKLNYDALSSGTQYLNTDCYQRLSHSTNLVQKAAFFNKDFQSYLSHPENHLNEKCYEAKEGSIFGSCDYEKTNNNDLQNISCQSHTQFSTKPEYHFTEGSSYAQDEYLKTENDLNTKSWETCGKSTSEESNTYFSLIDSPWYDTNQTTVSLHEGTKTKNVLTTGSLESSSFNVGMMILSSRDIKPVDSSIQSYVETDKSGIKKRSRDTHYENVDAIIASKQNNSPLHKNIFQKKHCNSMDLHDLCGETTLLMTPYRTHVTSAENGSHVFSRCYTNPKNNLQGMCTLENDSPFQQIPRLNESTSVTILEKAVERSPEGSHHSNYTHRPSISRVADDSNQSTHNSTSEHDTKSNKDSPGLSIENSPNVLESQITNSKDSISSKPHSILSHIILPSNKNEPSIVFQKNTHSFTHASNSTIHTLEKHTQQYSSLMSSSLQTSTLLPSKDTSCELTPEYFLSSPVPSVS